MIVRRSNRERNGNGSSDVCAFHNFTNAANDCFFCLSNVNVAKHLVVSIGTEVYLALAKGPLTTPDLVGMPFSGHVIIIPIAHTPMASETETVEMESYRQRLTKFFDERGCQTVTFEIRHSEGIHAHWQVVPVPKSISVESVEQAFIRGFDEKDMKLDKREPGQQEEFYRVVISSGSFVASLTPRFDLQLARKVLATLLKVEERQDWRSCIQSEDEEKAEAAAFRKEFE